MARATVAMYKELGTISKGSSAINLTPVAKAANNAPGGAVANDNWKKLKAREDSVSRTPRTTASSMTTLPSPTLPTSPQQAVRDTAQAVRILASRDKATGAEIATAQEAATMAPMRRTASSPKGMAPPSPADPKGGEARPARLVPGAGGGGEDDLIGIIHVNVVIVMGRATG
jgi:hypothetical protein